jgi:hypothetical protein
VFPVRYKPNLTLLITRNLFVETVRNFLPQSSETLKYSHESPQVSEVRIAVLEKPTSNLPDQLNLGCVNYCKLQEKCFGYKIHNTFCSATSVCYTLYSSAHLKCLTYVTHIEGM